MPINSQPTLNSRTSTGPGKAGELHSTLPLIDNEMVEIIREFHETLSKRLVAFQASFSDRNWQQLADHAHWLKGVGGTVGFDVVSSQAHALEQAVKAKAETSKIRSLLDAILESHAMIVLPDYLPNEELV